MAAFLKQQAAKYEKIAYSLPGALTPSGSFIDALDQVQEEHLEEAEKMAPEGFRECFAGFVKSLHRMDPIEKSTTDCL